MTKTLRTKPLTAFLLLSVAVAALLTPKVVTAGPASGALSITSHHHSHSPLSLPFMPIETNHHVTVTDQAPGGQAVAHYEGGVRHPGLGLHKRAPTAVLRPTGTQAAEPTMGIQKDGTMFYVGTDGPHTDTPFGPAPTKLEWPVMRSDDNGKTWTDVSPVVGPQRRHAVAGLDPMLHVDPDTGRVFTVDLQLLECHTVSFSDDDGGSWITSEACGVADHQTVFTGPPTVTPPEAMPLYPNVVYDCAIDGGALGNFGTMTSCLKSLNGGLTWTRTGEPAFKDDPNQEGGLLGIKGHCGGASGHGATAPRGTDDAGAIYLPRGWCRIPMLAISHDEGLTWDRVRVADTDRHPRYKLPASENGENEEHEAAVAVDKKGNLYYAWTGADRLFYLATSTDGGQTWSEPKMIAAPGVTETWGPTIAVGAPGKIAVAYIGSTDAPGGIGADGTGPEYDDVSWNGYITMTDEAFDKKPLYFSGTVNDVDDPLTTGKGCGILRCDQRIFDFLDVTISPDGVPYASMVASQSADGEFYPTWGTGFVGGLIGGPPLK